MSINSKIKLSVNKFYYNLILAFIYGWKYIVLFEMNEEEAIHFCDYIVTLPDHYEYKNSTKFMYDLIRPLYKELYSLPYENDTDGTLIHYISEKNTKTCHILRKSDKKFP